MDLKAKAEEIRLVLMKHVDREGEIDPSEIAIVDENIETVLRSVQEEAYQKAGLGVAIAMAFEEGHSQGFAEAIEKCLSIAENHTCKYPNTDQCAFKIYESMRALKPSEECPNQYDLSHDRTDCSKSHLKGRKSE